MTYTFCYCINRKCKSRFGEKKEDMFDQQHWGEIKENFGIYLKEEVCVPQAEKTVKVPQVVVDLLSDFLVNLKQLRASDTTNAAHCLDALSRTNESLSRLSYVCHQLNATPYQQPLRITASMAKTTATEPRFAVIAEGTDQFQDMALIIVKALHRAIYELVESKRTKDPAYVFHHLALVFDGLQELYRLVGEAMGHIGSERFLPPEHAHHGILEQRWQTDGI
ncbi:MAG: hypothetical protein ABL993_10575 [Vicinamibacterales bacterium]